MELRCSFYIPSSYFFEKLTFLTPVDYISVSASSLLCLSPRLSSVVLCVVLRANHRAGQVAFQGVVGQICLLDAAISTSSSRGNAILGHCEADMPARCLHERSPCASLSRNDNMATFWSSLSQGDYTSSGMSLLRYYVFSGDYFYWEFGALLRHTPLTWGFAPICGERGISHASRAFSLAARRGGPCKALTIRSYATKGRYFVSAHYLTRASS